MKTYRHIANVFKSQLEVYLINPQVYRNFIVHSFKEKIMWCDNPHRNRAFANEIKRLIGDEMFYNLLTMMLNDVYNGSNLNIEARIRKGYVSYTKSYTGKAYIDITPIEIV